MATEASYRPPVNVTLRRADGTPAGNALIDPDDLEAVSRNTWRLSHHGYAVRSGSGEDGRQTIYLHREILRTPKGLTTDHINGDRLDNRRSNLRVATGSQNNANGRDRSRRSGYRGVYWHGISSKKWVSQISVDGRLRHLGLFEDPQEAARTYDVAARAAWGPYARTNGFA